MRTVVYDIEIFQNFFSYTDIDVKTLETNVFVVHESQNMMDKLYEYLVEPKYRIGYNNVHFDRVVCDFITDNYEKWKKIPVRSALLNLYQMTQSLIKSETREFYRGSTEIDLFLLNHYNNKNRSTSLKALQCSIFWENVQDMPFEHTVEVTDDMIEEILSYNMNDVLSTKKFYELNLDKLSFRRELGKKYRKFMLNMPDIAIGEEIFLHEIRKQSGIRKNELKEKVSYDKTVDLGKCILPYVQFESEPFKQLLDKIKWTVVSDTQKLKYNVKYKGFHFFYGVGGIHGCIPPGIYVRDDNYVILDFDVKSYYPNLAIQNNLYPKHIPRDVFISTYNSIFEKRVMAQKQKDSTQDAGLKLALNGVFGKTGEVNSAFFDRYYFYSITLNGQLSLTMLSEKYMNHIQGLQILQINTDGVTVRVPKKSLALLDKINTEFMYQTGLILESSEYEKIIIRDVNNYLAITTDGKIKKKGIFETQKEFHKDNSFLIVPKALEQYYINNIPVEQTIKASKNIYDFCGRYKAYKGWSAVFNSSEEGEVTQKNYGKVLRFYPCTQGGGTSWKVNVDGRIHNLLANQATVLFNHHFPVDDFSLYHVNYEFFVNECYKIINEVEPKQLSFNF